ncbi:hypothetical protein GOODEAATRI_010699 [Goodea atripinnis]|uniref:Uncharacterized protein n=1 Tax=Goodea atripinnis TaxID=208336 RepID=A0ABV0PD09_9TELE
MALKVLRVPGCKCSASAGSTKMSVSCCHVQESPGGLYFLNSFGTKTVFRCENQVKQRTKQVMSLFDDSMFPFSRFTHYNTWVWDITPCVSWLKPPLNMPFRQMM